MMEVRTALGNSTKEAMPRITKDQQTRTLNRNRSERDDQGLAAYAHTSGFPSFGSS